MNTEKIIVVEDNSTMLQGIVESLRREGYNIEGFDNGYEALKCFSQKSFSTAVVDLKMDPINGIEILKKFKEINSSTEIIMISAFGSVEDAVTAMKLGAFDFLTKPFSPDELRLRVKKAVEKFQSEQKLQNLIETNRLLNEEISSGFEEIIGRSQSIIQVLKLVEQVADSESTVLIQGESGTGKELIARAIHKKSSRAENPFIKVNCAALNDNLIESELFGHEKGAFTGAIKLKKGRFELADSGTLFLDEIGDISQSLQVKLLRVLQDGEFERVGGEKTLNTNVRVISATNRNLQKLMSEGKFREDLYYRLSVIPVYLPPLRERQEDIPILTEYFLNKFANKFNRTKPQLSDQAMELLLKYFYPGNIRELENLIERLTVISTNHIIEHNILAGHLSNYIPGNLTFDGILLEQAVESFEKNLIIKAMKNANGIKNRAAKSLGISTSVLYYKLEKYDLI
jgi:two-component system, NtrC family, response regulator HydG